MFTEFVTQRRSSEAPPEALVTVLGCDGSDASGEPPAIAPHRPGPRRRVVAAHAATPGPNRLGTF